MRVDFLEIAFAIFSSVGVELVAGISYSFLEG